MKLRIKPEYLEFSVGGAGMNQLKMKNMPVNEYEKWYRNGLQWMFIIEDDEYENDNEFDIPVYEEDEFFDEKENNDE
jgi:hypothetical protein